MEEFGEGHTAPLCTIFAIFCESIIISQIKSNKKIKKIKKEQSKKKTVI